MKQDLSLNDFPTDIQAIKIDIKNAIEATQEYFTVAGIPVVVFRINDGTTDTTSEGVLQIVIPIYTLNNDDFLYSVYATEDIQTLNKPKNLKYVNTAVLIILSSVTEWNKLKLQVFVRGVNVHLNLKNITGTNKFLEKVQTHMYAILSSVVTQPQYKDTLMLYPVSFVEVKETNITHEDLKQKSTDYAYFLQELKRKVQAKILYELTDEDVLPKGIRHFIHEKLFSYTAEGTAETELQLSSTFKDTWINLSSRYNEDQVDAVFEQYKQRQLKKSSGLDIASIKSSFVNKYNLHEYLRSQQYTNSLELEDMKQLLDKIIDELPILQEQDLNSYLTQGKDVAVNNLNDIVQQYKNQQLKNNNLAIDAIKSTFINMYKLHNYICKNHYMSGLELENIQQLLYKIFDKLPELEKIDLNSFLLLVEAAAVKNLEDNVKNIIVENIFDLYKTALENLNKISNDFVYFSPHRAVRLFKEKDTHSV